MKLEESIKADALNLGFDLVGIASASDPLLFETTEKYSDWLDNGYGASMTYLERHLPLKANPGALLPSLKSVLCVGLYYGTSSSNHDQNKAQVSIYTRGKDYHDVLEERLELLAKELQKKHG
ncbi:MAG: QueG-associated DUF1730 domain-containing protein, partial [Bdellovibrionota bacterium]